MAHIVDDRENIIRFTATVSNVLASFARDGKYGRPSKDGSEDVNPSAISPQLISSPSMNTADQASDSARHHPDLPIPPPPPPPYTTEDLPGIMSASSPRIGNGHLGTDDETQHQHLELHSAHLSNGAHDDAVESTRFAVNKQFASPHLAGLRAPPPTPETRGHTMPPIGSQNGGKLTENLEEQLSNEELLAGHVEKHLASKSSSPGLGESMHAPKLSRFAGDLGFLQYEKSKRELSPGSRREREGSYKRLSFVVANASKASLESSIHADAGPKTGTKNPVGDEKEQLGQSGSKSSDWVPPHLRMTETTMSPVGVTLDEVRPTPAEAAYDAVPPTSAHESSETLLMKGFQVGLQSFMAKYRSQGKEAPQLEQAQSEESKISTAEDEGVLAPTTPTLIGIGVKAPVEGVLELDAITKATTTQHTELALRPRPITFSEEDVPSTGKGESSRSLLSPITPIPVKFEKLSPATARYVINKEPVRTLTSQTDDTDVVFLGKFPKPVERHRSAARVRRVIISRLPIPCTAKFVAGIVYGGALENIIIKSNGVAEVVFLDADHCAKYVNDSPNGLVYAKDGKRELYVLLNLPADPDIVGGKLAEMIARSVTRCVSATWVDSDWTMLALWKLAEGKNRKVESIEEETKTIVIASTGQSKQCRNVTFRFCKIDDASVFLGILQRDEEWELSKLGFADDPCALATGPHLHE